VLREWGRIGCTGFGGPPTHIKLLRDLCVEREKWLDAREFEDAVAACNLLPGPASTQLAIFCAWQVRGLPGALAGGAAFIVPGLAVIIALAARCSSPARRRYGCSALAPAPAPPSPRSPSRRAPPCSAPAGSGASTPSAGWPTWPPGPSLRRPSACGSC
jgi:hypothetical protein